MCANLCGRKFSVRLPYAKSSKHSLCTPHPAAAWGSSLRQAHEKRNLQSCVAGALLRPTSRFMVSVSIWGMGILAQTVNGARYSSDARRSAFAVDNIFILCGVALGRAVRRGGHVFRCFDRYRNFASGAGRPASHTARVKTSDRAPIGCLKVL